MATQTPEDKAAAEAAKAQAKAEEQAKADAEAQALAQAQAEADAAAAEQERLNAEADAAQQALELAAEAARETDPLVAARIGLDVNALEDGETERSDRRGLPPMDLTIPGGVYKFGNTYVNAEGQPVSDAVVKAHEQRTKSVDKAYVAHDASRVEKQFTDRVAALLNIRQ